MSTGKPRILFRMSLAVMLILTTSACALPRVSNDPNATPLTGEELAYFNGSEFFNGDDLNIRNQFLYSLYSDAKEIDLFELFYCGSGTAEHMTDDELRAVVAAAGEGWSVDNLPCPCEKISRADMDAVLTENMGLKLDDMAGVNLDRFLYLPAYDAYYHFHGDTNYRGGVAFYAGERQGDLIRLYYEDSVLDNCDKVVTLREEGGSYRFVSNQISRYTANGSVSQPEGVWAEGIAVPDPVKAAARDYVQWQYVERLVSDGACRAVNVQEQTADGAPVYDDWRVEGLAPVARQDTPDGPALEVYRLDYRMHTATPDRTKGVLTGAMAADAEGWFLPVYPGSTYLVFETREGEEPAYLFALVETGCEPGDAQFASDLMTAYASRGTADG